MTTTSSTRFGWTYVVVGVSALIALAGGCQTTLGTPPDDEGPFDRDVVTMCEPTTGAVSVRTSVGGRMSIRVRGGCAEGDVCVSSDRYAADAWASVRVTGSELLVSGCALDAVGADALEVTFEPEEGEPEVLAIPLEGSCLDAGTLTCAGDGGLPGDAGIAGDGGPGRRDGAATDDVDAG